jgi:uncharacterized protein
MPEPVKLLVIAAEVGFVLAGLGLLWRLVLGPRARIERRPPALRPWDAPVANFVLFLLFVMFGTTAVVLIGGAIARQLALTGDALLIFTGAAGQLGMLAGVAAYRFQVEPTRGFSDARADGPGVLVSGFVTFLIAWPLVIATGNAWEIFLRQFGVPAERQSLIRMFAHAESPLLLMGMTTVAVVLAPLAEEFVFRAGLFRYFRTRMPRIIALTAPGVLFASLHVENWSTLEGFASFAPLTMLAVVFSVAYERTGRIGTPIVAHALFNLNTVILILSGVGEVPA